VFENSYRSIPFVSASGLLQATSQESFFPSIKGANNPVEYVNLGHTGIKVSRLCLGCMSYGVPERGLHPWTLDEARSRPFIGRALELGINFFDTSNSYSDGTSEEIVGRALGDLARRDEVIIATKVYYPTRKGPNGCGLSRKAIMLEIDETTTTCSTARRSGR
jgi:1-deoxyxylulose-5-phosphate synthase